MVKNYLLNIHTTEETAFVALSKGDEIINAAFNHEFKEHATFLHVAIDKILKESNITLTSLGAISVTHGPGSYTGIRVGLAAAKGLCYAGNLPLITLNTLDVLAATAIDKLKDPSGLYCAMIDARRMEVYTSLYNFNNIKLIDPQPIILDIAFAEKFTPAETIYFFGSGSKKFEKLVEIQEHNFNFRFADIGLEAGAMVILSNQKFSERNFSNLAYSEPEYLKEFKAATNK